MLPRKIRKLSPMKAIWFLSGDVPRPARNFVPKRSIRSGYAIENHYRRIERIISFSTRSGVGVTRRWKIPGTCDSTVSLFMAEHISRNKMWKAKSLTLFHIYNNASTNYFQDRSLLGIAENDITALFMLKFFFAIKIYRSSMTVTT